MEKIAFQLAWLGEHKVLIFLFFAELLVAACLLIVFLHLRLSWRRLNFNKSDDKGSLNGFDLVDDPCFFLRPSDLFPLYVTKDFERQFGLTKEQFKNDVLCLAPKLPEEQAKRLRKEYNAWDGKRPILMDIEPLGMDACYRLSVTRKDGMDLFHFRDITEEKRQLDEMRADLDAAEEASQSKTSFLYRMSHEIRTPLNGIIGMLNLAHRQLHGHSTEDYIVKAEQLSEFLLTVINEVLDMSRIEVGKIELENKPFDLYHLADQIRNLFKKTIEEKAGDGICFFNQMQQYYLDHKDEWGSPDTLNSIFPGWSLAEGGEPLGNWFTPAGPGRYVFYPLDRVPVPDGLTVSASAGWDPMIITAMPLFCSGCLPRWRDLMSLRYPGALRGRLLFKQPRYRGRGRQGCTAHLLRCPRVGRGLHGRHGLDPGGCDTRILL
mgnify:CR=1 FL=1